jgi:hypothetical protein
MKDTYPNKVGLAPAATAGDGNAPVLIFNELMNLLIKILVRLGLLKGISTTTWFAHPW